ncbi:uncharacterized protein MONBRDRAFT_34007 [Monosiga brevicollis MX1]|uniref:H/ACA ribonucleoprotein complex subunit 2 n=1 Tax=Monosiga brevicollis TaxID=81824 RepID=A9V925_MONBE|nr:uncharacterized protein MONBRDRAFT_34007 [Monosiga brevicollis MX1]EDQ85979.1 predicted protein [Monosiga brevicollis MX1]|eukprot:XP_001749173.1 hypothetical protein [Monosiga brevicollis MX1]
MSKGEKKAKRAKVDKEEAEDESRTYEILASRVSVIAQPLASKKLTKKVYKVVKRAHKAKSLCRGVKEVSKALRKGGTGVCVFAGDISPIDVITHMPVMCEEAHVPYCFVPSKEDLGAAGQTKRPTSVVLIKTNKSVEGYEELESEVKELAA